MACSQPVGFVTNNTDCNDNNASLNTAITFYQDADGDGFGSALVTQMACSKPVGFVTNNTDCNDSQIQYADLDGDGLGSTTIVACGVTNNTDCNDNNALLNVTNTYYQDLDADGFGNPSITISACSAPIGYVLTGTDCDDTRANVHPGAIDVCYDGLDNDCNGVIDNVGQPGGCTPIVTTIRPETCGVTLTNIDQQILAYLVSNVQGYRWRVTKVIGGIPSTLPADIQYKETTLRALQLTQLTTYAYETTYQIEVSVKINNVWQPFYGNACYVITPTITTSIKPEYCGVPLSSFNQTVLSYLMSYTTGYRFRIKNTNTGQVQIVDRGLRDFRFNMITNPQFYVPYTIEVALRNTTGNYMAYGPVCNLMLQNTSSKEVEVKEASINAIVTPNPFSDSFNLKLENFKEDKLTISTYDLTGRLLETKTLTSSELSSVTFGENYPSGVYTLIITQNSLVKTIRVVKR